MRIAVCGSGKIFHNHVKKKAYEIGEELALNNIIVATGGCGGYPYEAVKGAYKRGLTIAISPAKNLNEHKKKYNYPTKYYKEFVFTGLGVPGRNLPLVMDSDAIIIIGGQSGTLIEFAVGFHENKIIGVLSNSGGITEIIPKLTEICNKADEKYRVIYEQNPKKLVSSILNLL